MIATVCGCGAPEKDFRSETEMNTVIALLQKHAISSSFTSAAWDCVNCGQIYEHFSVANLSTLVNLAIGAIESNIGDSLLCRVICAVIWPVVCTHATEVAEIFLKGLPIILRIMDENDDLCARYDCCIMIDAISKIPSAFEAVTAPEVLELLYRYACDGAITNEALQAAVEEHAVRREM